MKKKMVLSLILVCTLGLALITGAVFWLQTNSAYTSADDISPSRLKDVQDLLARNEADVAELKQALDTEYLQKARAFSEMIKLKPEVLEDFDELCVIQRMLGVDELHVTDENGVLLWGTVKDYYGFDFNTSEQTKPFLRILTDPTYELAQEPTPNGAEQKLFQYISVARYDETGIVQVGMTPARLENALEKGKIDAVLNNFLVGHTGYVFAVRNSDGNIASHPNSSLIGTTFEEKLTDKPSFIKLDNQRVYCTSKDAGDYTLVAALPEAEMFSERNMVTVIVFVFSFLVFAIICIILNINIQKNIISGIYKFVGIIKEVGHGNLNCRAEVRNNPEFITLSDGLNSMVDGIKQRMTETQNYLEQQQQIVKNITGISHTVGDYSSKMLGISNSIADGASRQEASVSDLQTNFNDIAEQVKNSAEVARSAREITKHTQESLSRGNQQIENMQISMDKIKTTSAQINNIVKTIEDISFQTNILALNAAVEAARAGSAGKGFAVVADEVRTLANRSSEAVKGTEKLINAAIDAVKEGTKIAQETAETISEVVSDASQSADIIHQITNETEKQATAIIEATAGFGNVMEVVRSNTAIAAESQDTANMIASQADSLMSLIRQ